MSHITQFCIGTGIDPAIHPYVMEDIAVASFIHHGANLPEEQWIVARHCEVHDPVEAGVD
jgi:hypothetical protein